MSYTDPSSSNVEDKPIFSKIGCVSVLIPVVGLLYLYASWEPRPPLQPILNAEPYVWPEECPQRQYETGDHISSKCLVPKYIIHDWYSRGLSQPSRTPRDEKIYYRVGDDAIAYICSWGDENKCSVLDRQKKFFDVRNKGL